MVKKLPHILGLGAALASLSGATALTPTTAAANEPATNQADHVQKGQAVLGEPNVFFPAGKDLLGLIVTTAANGTVLARHYSMPLFVTLISLFALLGPVVIVRA